jgi:hypothetical protein
VCRRSSTLLDMSHSILWTTNAPTIANEFVAV